MKMIDAEVPKESCGASGAWRPDRKDVRMLRKCCICPPLASVCLVMVLVMTALWICCEMVGGLVFYDKDSFRFIGLAVYIAFACVLMAGFCYCALAPKFAMRSKRWKALEASGVRAKTPGLVAEHAIPEGFRRQFLAGDIYTKIRQPSEDVGDCSVSCSFATDELADFDEHTTPTINLSVTPK